MKYVFPFIFIMLLSMEPGEKEVNKIITDVLFQSEISLEPSVPCLFSPLYIRTQIV